MRRCLEGRPKERSRSPPEKREVCSGGNNESDLRCAEPELHVLYASPLDQRIPQINIQGEVDLLQESLRKANCHMNISVGAATTKRFAQLLTLAQSAGGIILHLSVHVVNAETNVGIVFENDFGGAHILYRQELEELLGGQQLEGLSFVFINGCSSESFAALLVEAGCSLVIATRGKVYDVAATAFTQQFYYALGSQVSVRSAFERAQQVLRVDPDPKVKASADMFVLFGQHAARSHTLPRRPIDNSMADGQKMNSGLQIDSNFGSSVCLPPRVEDYIDRSSVLCDILRHFESSSCKPARRACILSGPEGIGKTVAAIELAHFASSPGRLFSRNVLYVPIDGKPDLANVVQGISQALASRRPPLLTTTSRSQKDVLLALQQMDQTRNRYLLLLDDRSGAVRASPQVRSLLSNMLETARNLSLVVCSREQVYESLGPCKCVNVPLGALTDAQSAELFLKRMHRPLLPCDLDPRESAVGNLMKNDLVLQKLAAHPLLRQIAGNPGLVNAMCQHVTPKLRSLWDLCSPQWRRHDQVVRTRSFDSETPNSHGSLFRRMSEDGTESLQLTRRMSIDGVHTEPLVRMMSFDGPPLARMMSVDETQATENGIDQI